MRGTRRGQHPRFVSAGSPHRLRLRGGLAVEADADKASRNAPYAVRLAATRIANRGIQASRADAGHDRIPDRHPMCAYPRKAIGIRQLGQRLVQDGAQDRPELIARMRVVLARREGRLARKASQDQNPRILRDHGWQAAPPATRGSLHAFRTLSKIDGFIPAIFIYLGFSNVMLRRDFVRRGRGQWPRDRWKLVYSH